ncbi:MAG: hypothetical protein IPI46_02245 [Bacteroidetes bacterium]|nr:hypothetical protein [Bacteroidota bacterium]
MKLKQFILPIYMIIALLCLIIASSIKGLWFHAAHLGNTHAESVTLFLQFFPNAMQETSKITGLSLVLGLITIVFSMLSISKSSGILKFLNFVFMSLGFLNLALDLFSLM